MGSSVRMSSLSFEYLPARSQVKELNLVVRLSTKGMTHSLSHGDLPHTLISSEFTQVKSVLSQLEKANVLEITGMTKGSSGSELKKIKTVVVLGQKSSGHVAAAEVSPIGVAGETFGLRYEGKIEMPKLMNRWNIEKMTEETLKGAFQGQLFFGKPDKMESIKVVAKLEKTEELKKEILESPEYKQCMVEQRNQMLLTPVCNIVRLLAASMDKIHLTIHTPKVWSNSYIMNLFDGVSKALLLGNVESEKAFTGTEGVAIAEARADRVSQMITAKVWTPTRELLLRNIRVMGFARFFLPATALRTPMEVAALKLSGDLIPATCTVEASYVRTFDNMTLQYEINDCEHVLLMDGSRHIPIAVTTKVELIPKHETRTGSMRVMINDEQIVLPAVGEQLVKKNSEGEIVLVLMHYQDNVIKVHIPRQGLVVLSNGVLVEVVAPQLLKSRAVGLCGDMNGEHSADLKTPGMCVMRPHLAALSYLINKSGSASGFERCSGIPATLKTEFQTESAQCARETLIPTPVSILAERISILNRPVGMTHVVEKQSTKLCISKQMVKPCLSKPLSIKQKSVEFSCVSHPSMLSRSLEKRALAGESLIQEIGQLPTVFRKVEFEPVACKSEMSSISL